MSTGRTEFVGLHLWDGTDHFLRTEFNEDNAKIDEVFQAVYAAMEAESGRVDEKMQELRAEQLQIETGSYTGTGVYGAETPNRLTFSRVPKAVWIVGSAGQCSHIWYYGVGRGAHSGSLSVYAVLTWDGTTLSWYGNSSSQLNTENVTYRYLAIA